VLLGHALRRLSFDLLLVDLPFIESVLLDWTVWQTRLTSWQLVWSALLHSVNKDNRYRRLNVGALLDAEIIETMLRIPMVSQYLMFYVSK